MIHIGYLVNPADLHSPAPPRSADRTPGSGRGLPKTGIFQISAGDYRRFPSCSGQFGRSTVRLHAQPRLPGTEFLDAETGRQKPPPKCANAHRDQNPGIESPEMPAETPYWTSCRTRAVCGDWMVVCAVICEPVSAWNGGAQALSCYSAKQALEASKQALRNAISGIGSLR